MRDHWSLRRQIVPALVAICLVGTLGICWYSARVVREAVRAQATRHAASIANGLVYAAEIVDRDAELQRLVTTFGAEPEVRTIAIVSFDPARVLAATRREWVGRSLEIIDDADVARALDRPFLTGEVQHVDEQSSGALVYAIPVSLTADAAVIGGHEGRAIVVVDPVHSRALARRALSWLALGGCLLTLVLLGALSYLLDRRVARPLFALDAAVQRRRADPTVRAPVGGSTEMVNLGRALNDLIDGLEARELEMRGILEGVLEAVVSTDDEGRIRFWNQGAARLFGWSADEVVGRPVAECLAPAGERSLYEEWLRGLERSVEPRTFAVRGELTLMHRHGHEIPVEVSLAGQRLGGRWRFSSFCYDLSARREQERALHDARTAALQASELKSQFLAMVSHELRTPLNGILGMSSILMDTPLDAEQRESVEIVLTAGQALLGVVEDILDFSKIETGRLAIAAAPFEIATLVEDTVHGLVPSAVAKGLEIVVACDPSLPDVVVGDGPRVRQILTNLVSNAIKFSERGNVVVAARVRGGDGEAVVVRFDVTDTGQGIPPEARDRVFEPFVQLDGSDTRRHGGTGLGLAISRQLAHLLDGRLAVDSVVGAGSTFWFEIPLRRSAGRDGAPRPDLEASRVLLVSANDALRSALREQFEAWNAVVEEAASAEEAMRRVRRPHGGLIRFVVVDEQVGGVAGTVVPRALRRFLVDDPPWYLLLCDGTRLVAAEDVGVDAVVPKPLRRKSLLTVVERLPAMRRHGRAGFVPRVQRVRRADGGRPSILVVEDDLTNQRVVLAMLRRMGCTAEVVGNGRLAVEAVSARPYDVVLMDCDLPVLDGVGATREIRALEGAGRHTPIVAMTANVLDENLARCHEVGMDGFVPKPFTEAQLEAVLRTHVEVLLDDAGPSGLRPNPV